ncbi:MAG: pseudouridine synthase [Butyricicoccaceae bacterium]
MEERLQKLLAQAGLCSRREAERWIDDGRVTVNGKKASVGDKADPRRDKIFVDGKPIGGAEEKVYLMLYKPRGYVTTMKDEHGRKTVADLVRGCGARVVPVGRLDYNSEGLLLLTNDGDLLNALTHPRHEVEKHYEAACAAIWKTSRNSQSRWRLTATASVWQRLLPLTVTKSARSCA